MLKLLPRFMLAAPTSGQGKTTVTLALLVALRSHGRKPVSFKNGPDYIDPSFHKKALGVPSHNLDLFMSEPKTVLSLVAKACDYGDIAVIEGAMGYYDGVGVSDKASCYEVACVTQTPVILVVEAKGAALSLAAAIKGINEFRSPSNIKGIILNRCSEGFYNTIAPVIEKETGLPVLGFLPNLPECTIKSRHLGLFSADETEDIEEKLIMLGKAATEHIDIKRLEEIALSAENVEVEEEKSDFHANATIAVALDEAFYFYYSETLELFESLGAKIEYFSPIHDKKLPENATALYLGGGYPELYAKELSQNKDMLRAVKNAIDKKLPCLAECGGFIYLHETIRDADGETYPLVGAIKGRTAGGKRLSHFGYITMRSRRNNLLCSENETMKAHEFHYWQSDNSGVGFYASKANGAGWDCIHASDSLFAGFAHLYLLGNKEAAERFLIAAEKYGEQNEIE